MQRANPSAALYHDLEILGGASELALSSHHHLDSWRKGGDLGFRVKGWDSQKAWRCMFAHTTRGLEKTPTVTLSPTYTHIHTHPTPPHPTSPPPPPPNPKPHPLPRHQRPQPVPPPMHAHLPPRLLDFNLVSGGDDREAEENLRLHPVPAGALVRPAAKGDPGAFVAVEGENLVGCGTGRCWWWWWFGSGGGKGCVSAIGAADSGFGVVVGGHEEALGPETRRGMG